MVRWELYDQILDLYADGQIRQTSMNFENHFPIEISIAELFRPHFGEELQYSQELLQMTGMRFCLWKILKETDHMYFRISIRGLTSLLRSVTLAEYPSVQHIGSTQQPHLFRTQNPSVQHQKPLSSTQFLSEGCVELRGFLCGTEGFWCWTEEFSV